jgi:flavin-dependent dehydrogenase
LLIGDAAGLADPFVGEGLYYAFLNSKIAANNIINFFKIDNYNLAKEYHNNIDSQLTKVLKVARLFMYIFNLFPNFLFWFGSETSIGNEIMISLVTGEIRYNEIYKIFNCFKKRFFIKLYYQECLRFL